MEDWKAKQAARASMAKALQATNPHLVPISEKIDALQAAAKNIRIELARAFPAVKFSVKSRRFSGGDAIDVKRIDGPVCRQVDEIIDRYSAGSFNGMDDSYSYHRDAWKDAFGDAKYVHSARDASDKAVASAARYVCGMYGVDVSKFPPDGVVAAFRSGELYRIQPSGSGHFNLQDLIWQELSRRTWSVAKRQPVLKLEEALES